MSRDEIIARLKENETMLRERAWPMWLYSAPAVSRVTIFDYVDLKDSIAALFEGPVDE